MYRTDAIVGLLCTPVLLRGWVRKPPLPDMFRNFDEQALSVDCRRAQLGIPLGQRVNGFQLAQKWQLSAAVRHFF
jgi:hypothetical protein